MGRSGFDSGQLKAFAKKLEKLTNGEVQAFSKQCVNELAGRVYRETVMRTPERLGTLRDGWEISDTSVSGQTYTVTVCNSVEYAPYVEYGHRQVVGGKISEGGKIVGFTTGQFMLTRAEERVRNISDKIMQAKLNKFLREAFKDDE